MACIANLKKEVGRIYVFLWDILLRDSPPWLSDCVRNEKRQNKFLEQILLEYTGTHRMSRVMLNPPTLITISSSQLVTVSQMGAKK